jgi:ssDNA thymidine ADP-ribosyltransferase, DarT
MPRPVPTRVLHFTHLEHLPRVVAHGLLSDTAAQARGLLTTEVGNREIKERRRRRPVPVPPGGVVADYVPFYFAPRSPMMYAIDRGNVPEYVGGIDPLVYLVTTVERLQQTGCSVVTTDRNAVLGLAAFRQGLEGLDAGVDWQLMEATWWNNTIQEPDRMERRMAECLAHQVVPWEAVTEVHVRTNARKAEVEALLGQGMTPGPVLVTPDWYY